jgi:hypothetical protein
VNYRNDWKQKRSRVTVFADRSTRRWDHLCYGKATLNFKGLI